MYLYPIILTVLSSTTYHFLLKHMSSKASPLLILFWSYLLAASLCLVVLLTQSENVKMLAVFKDKGWMPILLALALLGIEVGYIWSYKNGGKVGQVSMVSQMVSTVVLLGIGFIMTREPLTMQKVFGVATALFGFHLLR